MNKTLNLIQGTVTIAFLLLGSHAIAQSLTSAEFSSGKTRIQSEYKANVEGCASKSGNANDICMAEVKGKKAIALSELDQQHNPSIKNQYKVSMAKGEATYDVARETCDDLSGNPKDVCVKEAKSAWVAAKSEATVQMKTSTTNADAKSDNKEVREDATEDKRAAALKVAEEKCEALANTAKEKCLAAARAKFEK